MTKKRLTIIFFITIISLGLCALLILVNQRQYFGKKAATSGGVGKITLNPQTVTKYTGERFSTVVKFRTGTSEANAKPISGVVFRITYPYSGTAPELEVVDVSGSPSNQIYPDSALVSSGDWWFPFKSVSRSGGMVTIELSAVNTSLAGYRSVNEVALATVYFKVNRPLTNPLTLSFDMTGSQIMTKTDPSVDVLDLPVNGVYTLGADTSAPSVVSNLSVSSQTLQSVNLAWSAPSDVGPEGKANSYDLRYSTSQITDSNWASATAVSGLSVPASAGTNQTFTVSNLSSGTTYFFAIKSTDVAGNLSGLSNVVSKATNAGSLSFGFKLQGVTGTGLTEVFDVMLRNSVNTKTYSAITFRSNSQAIFLPAVPIALTSFSLPSAGIDTEVLVKDDNHLRKKLGSLLLRPVDNIAPDAWKSLVLKIGDFNNTNTLTFEDIIAILTAYTAVNVPVTGENRKFDANMDNTINMVDISTVLSNYTAVSVPGDN